MDDVELWPGAPDLVGLVDLCYRVKVGEKGRPVLPDGRAGLVWLSDGTLHVCGPETRAWRPLRGGVRVVGLRLALAAAPAVLGVPAHTLTDRRVPLSEVWGPAARELSDRLERAVEPAEQTELMQDAVRARGASVGRLDPVARSVAAHMAAGRPRVDELAADLHLSPRQLRRRCAVAFGYPPVFLARLSRLHRFLRVAGTARPGTLLADVAALAGYADQAHLNRESRALTGQLPSVFLGTNAGSR